MGKVSSADKMRIQTLREQGYGAKAIITADPQNYCKLSTMKKICKRVDQTGSVTQGWQWSAEIRTLGNKHRAC